MTSQSSQSQIVTMSRSHEVLSTDLPEMSTTTELTRRVAPRAHQAPVLDEFPKFNSLPTEVRVDIWKLASIESRVVEVTLAQEHHEDGTFTTRWKQMSPNPGVLSANIESRMEALKHYKTKAFEQTLPDGTKTRQTYLDQYLDVMVVAIPGWVEEIAREEGGLDLGLRRVEPDFSLDSSKLEKKDMRASDFPWSQDSHQITSISDWSCYQPDSENRWAITPGDDTNSFVVRLLRKDKDQFYGNNQDVTELLDFCADRRNYSMRFIMLVLLRLSAGPKHGLELSEKYQLFGTPAYELMEPDLHTIDVKYDNWDSFWAGLLAKPRELVDNTFDDEDLGPGYNAEGYFETGNSGDDEDLDDAGMPASNDAFDDEDMGGNYNAEGYFEVGDIEDDGDLDEVNDAHARVTSVEESEVVAGDFDGGELEVEELKSLGTFEDKEQIEQEDAVTVGGLMMVGRRM